jgi:tetratricopeptide (TPR) repeat protein
VREEGERERESGGRATSPLVFSPGARTHLSPPPLSSHTPTPPPPLPSLPFQAIAKFKAALAIDPAKHDALWCLGNAYTSQGFLTADSQAAGALFTRAAGCFEQAVAADPGSEVYKKALEMTSKAPALHAELQKQLAASAAAAGGGGMGGGGGGRGGGGGGGRGGADASSDWWFDVGGWVVLAALVAGVAFAARGSGGK